MSSLVIFQYRTLIVGFKLLITKEQVPMSMKQVSLLNCFRHNNITRVSYHMVLSVRVCVCERGQIYISLSLSLSLCLCICMESMQIQSTDARAVECMGLLDSDVIMISLWINSIHQNLVTFCNRSVSTALTPFLSRPRFSNSARKSTTRKSANFFAPSPCVAILVENARMKLTRKILRPLSALSLNVATSGSVI